MIRNIIIAILILGFIGVVVFLDVPGIQNILSVRKQIEAEKENFSQSQAFLEKVEGLIDVYEQNKESIDKMGDILPQEEDIPNLIVQVEALVFEQGLILDKLEINSPTEQAASGRAEEIRAGGQAATQQKYKTLNIDLGFTGDYWAMKNFLKATEENMRLIDIDSISLSPQEEASGIFTFTLTLKTYYQ